jgi:hypothetical protein
MEEDKITIEELLQMMLKNDRAIRELRKIVDDQREELHQVSAMALEDNEYVRGQRAAIQQIEEMLPPAPGWKPSTV